MYVCVVLIYCEAKYIVISSIAVTEVCLFLAQNSSISSCLLELAFIRVITSAINHRVVGTQEQCCSNICVCVFFKMESSFS